MSDRIAVFNAGRIEQVGPPGRGLRAPGAPRSSPASSAPRTCSTARRRRAVLGQDGTWSVRPEKIRLAARGRAGRPTTSTSALGTVARGRLRRARPPASSSTSTPAARSRSLQQNLRTSSMDVQALPRHPRPAGLAPRATSSDVAELQAVRAADGPSTSTSMRRKIDVGDRTTRSRGRVGRGAPRRPCSALAACGSSGDSGGDQRRRASRRTCRRCRAIGDGEGAVNILAWPGYAEDGSHRPEGRLGHARSRSRPAARRTSRSPHLRRDVRADGHRRVRRRVRLRRRLAAADRRRRRRAGQHRPGAELRRHRAVPEGPAVELGRRGRRTASRTAGAPTCCVGTDKVDARRPTRGASSSTELAVQGQGHGLRLADLHRRRRAVPDEDPAGPGIKNPYALDQKQFDAAVDLLKQQKPIVGEYWSTTPRSRRPSRAARTVARHDVAGHRNLAQADKAPVDAMLPKEGATGWSDTWMVDAKAPHPNCAYKWMDYIVSPKVNAAGRRVLRRGAGQPEGVRLTTATRTHCDDVPRRRTRRTPSRSTSGPRRSSDCLDGRTDVKCIRYAEWTKAWSTRCAATAEPRGRPTPDRAPRWTPRPSVATGVAAASLSRRRVLHRRPGSARGCSRRRCCGSSLSTSGRWRRCCRRRSSASTSSPTRSCTRSRPRTSQTCSPTRPTCDGRAAHGRHRGCR